MPAGPGALLLATRRSIAALFVQPSFPDCTGIVQTKRSLPDRADSSSLAESAASATLEQRALSAADFCSDRIVSSEAASARTDGCALAARWETGPT
jgi:hypothetical protein